MRLPVTGGRVIGLVGRGRRMLAGLLAVAALSVAGGCTFFAPGMTGPDLGESDNDSPALEEPEVTRITGALIAEQQQRREQLEIRRRQRARTGTNPEEDTPYRVGEGDILNVIVWNHPDLSNPMGQFQDAEQQGRLVRADGTIFFPFVGEVQAAGRTADEIREAITVGLRPYIEEPQVDVRVVAFRSRRAHVTGAVDTPTRIRLDDDPAGLIEAISKAGGLTSEANQRQAVLTRDGQPRRIDLAAVQAGGAADIRLRDGDVLYIPEAGLDKVYVMGETGSQRSVAIPRGGLNLADALAEAQGIDLTQANTAQVFVIRSEVVRNASGEPTGLRPQVFHLDTREATSLVLAEGFELAPRDVVFVSATSAVRLNRVLDQVAPVLGVLQTTVQLWPQ